MVHSLRRFLWLFQNGSCSFRSFDRPSVRSFAHSFVQLILSLHRIKENTNIKPFVRCDSITTDTKQFLVQFNWNFSITDAKKKAPSSMNNDKHYSNLCTNEIRIYTRYALGSFGVTEAFWVFGTCYSGRQRRRRHLRRTKQNKRDRNIQRKQ